MFVLPKLPYEFNALEPYIDAKTMEIHYTKHHQGYVDKLNKALEAYPEFQKKNIEELLSDLNQIPASIRMAVRNQGGGHANHSFFWPILQKNSGSPTNEIGQAVAKTFGSFEKFKQNFSEAGASLFGSGWVWLVSNKNKLEIITTSNQDSPLSQSKKPILTLDVWEHAYYLKYQNRRPEYIEAFFQVINWDRVNQNYLAKG
jgi:Fe-Mn family superoxide dismutase